MSHEALWQAANYLKAQDNPLEQEGGRKLGQVADILLSQGVLPLTNGTTFQFPDQETVDDPVLHDVDFDYDKISGRIFNKDGAEVNHLTPAQQKLFGRLLATPSQFVSARTLAVVSVSRVDKEAIEDIKGYISRIRKKLPISEERRHFVIENKFGIGYRYNPATLPKNDSEE